MIRVEEVTGYSIQGDFNKKEFAMATINKAFDARGKFSGNFLFRGKLATLIFSVLLLGIVVGAANAQERKNVNVTERLKRIWEDLKEGNITILTQDDIDCIKGPVKCIKRGLCDAYSFSFCDNEALLRSIIASSRRLNQLYLFTYTPTQPNNYEHVVIYNSDAERVILLDPITVAAIQVAAASLKNKDGWSPSKIFDYLLPINRCTGHLQSVGSCLKYESKSAFVKIYYSNVNTVEIYLVNKQLNATGLTLEASCKSAPDHTFLIRTLYF